MKQTRSHCRGLQRLLRALISAKDPSFRLTYDSTHASTRKINSVTVYSIELARKVTMAAESLQVYRQLLRSISHGASLKLFRDSLKLHSAQIFTPSPLFPRMQPLRATYKCLLPQDKRSAAG